MLYDAIQQYITVDTQEASRIGTVLKAVLPMYISHVTRSPDDIPDEWKSAYAIYIYSSNDTYRMAIPKAEGTPDRVVYKFEGVQVDGDFKYPESVRRAIEQMQHIVHEIREAVADYMQTEGCACCRDIDGHKANARKLAKLLDVPMYSDGSGYNFAQFRSIKR